jgi:predicted NUDIX family phosphoesterase/dephospho-CoA kinase
MNETKYMPRRNAEGDDNHKQIITYVMVTRKHLILAYKRGNYTRAEDFLRGSHCVGFGGHVSSEDRNLFSAEDIGIRECAIRELAEELKLPEQDYKRLVSGSGLELVGILNDDSSANGRRHLAYVFRFEASNDPAWDSPERNEKSITQLRWLDPSASSTTLWEFEYWSQLCLLTFYKNAEITKPACRINRRLPLCPPHVLCVVGSVGSGKSEATRVLVNDFDYTEINSGRIVSELLGIPPVTEATRAIFQEKAWNFIQTKDGPRKLAKAIWAKASQQASPRILIDGIRQRKTLEELKALASHVRVGILFVHTLPHIAYEFYSERDNRQPIAIQDFLRIREAPVEREVEGMIEIADAVLYNWKGRKQYSQVVHEVFDEAD